MSGIFHIDSKLQAWTDPLTAEEYAQIEASLLRDGYRDPLREKQDAFGKGGAQSTKLAGEVNKENLLICNANRISNIGPDGLYYGSGSRYVVIGRHAELVNPQGSIDLEEAP